MCTFQVISRNIWFIILVQVSIMQNITLCYDDQFFLSFCMKHGQGNLINVKNTCIITLSQSKVIILKG